MKRVLIACLMLCLLAPTTMEAKKKKFGNNLYWELSTDGTLTISGTGAMPDFFWDKNKAPWSGKSDKIMSVVIEQGITSIGEDAFHTKNRTYNIRSVSIPNSVTSIGVGSFNGCRSLTSVVIPNSVTSIGRHSFSGCVGLSSVAIPNSVTCIGYGAFEGCRSLTSVEIPNSVTSIGSKAFQQSGLISVEIPNSVTSIQYDTFFGCDNLTSVTIPNSITFISDWAFYSCDRLTSITIPNSVTSIGDAAFNGCIGLTSVEIPNSVKKIGRGAFRDFNGEIISLPSLVTESNNPEQWGFSRAAVDAYKNSVRDSSGKIILAAKKGRTATKQTCGSTTYYLVAEDGKKGIMGTDGQWIVPMTQDYSAMELIGNGRFVKVRKSNFYGIMTLTGEVIIPVSRNYTSIGDFDSSSRTFAYTRQGFSGTCNEQGQEISEEKLPLTADNIKERGGYTSAVEMMDGTTKYFKVSKGGRYGLTDAEGNEIIPTELEALESAGTGYLRYKLNGFWGLMNYTGKILIDTDRGYTSIGDYKSFNKRFAYTMTGYKGECDATGRQISKIQVDTPQQAATSSVDSPAVNSGNTGTATQTIVVEHKHDPVPMQVWHQCEICFGSGTCQSCVNIIWPPGSDRKCFGCGWSRKCQFCAGNGGHYEVEYR